MNILLIGNGFDLEHGLPTKYTDFLEFCRKVAPIYSLQDAIQDLGLYAEIQYDNEYLRNWNIAYSVKKSLKIAFRTRQIETDNYGNEYVVTDNKSLDELYSLIRNNAWLKYFYKRASSIGKNWIDFEAEISNVVQALSYELDNTSQDGRCKEIPQPHNTRIVEINNAASFLLASFSNKLDGLQQRTNHLDYELNRFIRAFEIYLSVFVNSITVKHTCADIAHLAPDCVLSFNYSNTYERIYGKSRNIHYDFIHGKADVKNTLESCNMVLGIDEYLGKNDRQKKLEFLSFKKYYQRIYKSTDNAYLDWLDEITTKPAINHTLYIFGHSLNETDKDVLEKLICNDNVQTKIFYYRKSEHDKSVLGQLIHNLVRIIGQDELIRRTGGSHKTIEFIPQTLHE